MWGGYFLGPNMKCTIYTTKFCGYCTAAKRLLSQKHDGEVEEIDLSADPEALTALKLRTGHTTVPLIFMGDKFIGGFTELRAYFTKH